jgi:hypothetical protein
MDSRRQTHPSDVHVQTRRPPPPERKHACIVVPRVPAARTVAPRRPRCGEYRGLVCPGVHAAPEAQPLRVVTSLFSPHRCISRVPSALRPLGILRAGKKAHLRRRESVRDCNLIQSYIGKPRIAGSRRVCNLESFLERSKRLLLGRKRLCARCNRVEPWAADDDQAVRASLVLGECRVVYDLRPRPQPCQRRAGPGARSDRPSTTLLGGSAQPRQGSRAQMRRAHRSPGCGGPARMLATPRRARAR